MADAHLVYNCKAHSIIMLTAILLLTAVAAIFAQQPIRDPRYYGYGYPGARDRYNPYLYGYPDRYNVNRPPAYNVNTTPEPAVVPERPRELHPIRYLDESPKPYSFSYSAPVDEGIGSSSRQETADGTGRVEGVYTVTNEEGHGRVVEYVADEGGFRAKIRTNEPGTDIQNPADVVIEHLDTPPRLAHGVPAPVAYSVEAENPVEDKTVVEQPVIPANRRLYQRPPYWSRQYANRYRGRYNPYDIYGA